MNYSYIIKRITGSSVYQQLPGGISNQNYKVFIPNEEKHILLTLYPQTTNWWKVEKEHSIQKLLEQSSVPHPSLIKTGYIFHDQTRIAFVIREYIYGESFDELLVRNDISESNWANVLRELGLALAKIHSIPLQSFGLIRGKEISSSMMAQTPPAARWSYFVEQDLRSILNSIGSLPHYRRIGLVDQKKLKEIAECAFGLYLELKDSLFSVTQAYLTHNDARFGNFIVNIDPLTNSYRLSSIIDFEWALGGDPEIDLIQIENWLQFTSYLEQFMAHKHVFIRAYTQKRKVSEDYSHKRVVYHMYRSLSYLQAVFTKYDSSFVTSETISYVERHFTIIESIVLRKVDILPNFGKESQ